MAILPTAPRIAPCRAQIGADDIGSDVDGWSSLHRHLVGGAGAAGTAVDEGWPVLHQRTRQGRRTGRSQLVQALDLAPAPRRAGDLAERRTVGQPRGRHRIQVAYPTLPPPIVVDPSAFIAHCTLDGVQEPHRLRGRASRADREAQFDALEPESSSGAVSTGSPRSRHMSLQDKLLELERRQRDEQVAMAEPMWQTSPDGEPTGYSCCTIYVPKTDLRLVLREQINNKLAENFRFIEERTQAPLIHLGHLVDGDRTQQACVYSYWHDVSSTLHCGDRPCPQMADDYYTYPRAQLDFELRAAVVARSLFAPLQIIRDKCATHVVMPLAHGTLSQACWLLDKQRSVAPLSYSAREAQLFCEQAAAGLLFNLKHLHQPSAHSAEGLCHGDVHPDSVLISVGLDRVDVQLNKFGYAHAPREEMFMSGTLDWAAPASYLHAYFDGRRDDCFRLGRLLVTMAHPASSGTLLPTHSYHQPEPDSLSLAVVRHNKVVARALTAVLAASRDFRWTMCHPQATAMSTNARADAKNRLAAQPLYSRRSVIGASEEFTARQLAAFDQTLDWLSPFSGSNLERLLLALIEPRASRMLRAPEALEIWREGLDFADSFCSERPARQHEDKSENDAALPRTALIALREAQRRKQAANVQLTDFTRSLTGFESENSLWALASWERDLGLLRVQADTYVP